MPESRPLLAITMGDPAGIGPEVVVEALSRPEIGEVCRPLVVGDLKVLQEAARIKGVSFDARVVEGPAAAAQTAVLDLRNVDLAALSRGAVSAAAGRAAYEYVTLAARMALRGEVGGIVTGPLNKEALHLAGCAQSGHTEILAALCAAPEVAMMLAAGDLRVSHVTTHVSLRRACDLVRRERILTVIKLTDAALRSLGIARPALAVAGLNPHAGEAGLFGDEEQQEIAPAVAEAGRMGFRVSGPHPPDTLFVPRTSPQGGRRWPYDAAVVMCHDQGHIPIKLLDFQGGVNLTLGLPIVRTSVDHGTAFDIAGTGRASPASMIEAIRMAARLAASRP